MELNVILHLNNIELLKRKILFKDKAAGAAEGEGLVIALPLF